MCSCRTYVPVVACLLIPGFELRAALRARPRLALEPAALAPAAGEEPLLGPVTAAAEAAGVKPGMRLGEALATCPALVLVDRDPAAVEREWEGVLRRLEDAGFAVDPVEHGAVVFETRGVERLYGGVRPALERALAAAGSAWDPRIGAAGRRFTALAAASVARPGQIMLVAETEEQAFLEPLPLSLLPLPADRYAELEGLGLRRLGELARAPGRRGGRAARHGRDETHGSSRAEAGRRGCAGAGLRWSSPRRSCSRRRSRTSSRCAGRSAPSSSACSRVPNEQGGPSARSRWPPGSSMAAPGGVRSRSAMRPPSSRACASRSGRSSRSSPLRSSSSGSRRSSWRSTRASSSPSSSPPERTPPAASAKGSRQVAGEHGDRIGVRRGGGGAVVAYPGDASARGSQRRMRRSSSHFACGTWASSEPEAGFAGREASRYVLPAQDRRRGHAGEPWVPPRYVVEVAPWSRIPETRALVVPRDGCSTRPGRRSSRRNSTARRGS